MPTRRIAIAAVAVALAGATGASARVPAAPEALAPGPLGDAWIGRPDAPTAIVEYASVTCVHCATFHREVRPRVLRELVDAGRARLTLREFPLDPISYAAFMLARSGGGSRYNEVLDDLFATQREWAFSERPLDGLLVRARALGFDRDAFEAAMRDDRVFAGVKATLSRASDLLGVTSTPTFFVGARRLVGAVGFDEIERATT